MNKLNRAFENAYGVDIKELQEVLAIAGDLYNSDEIQGLAQFEQHLEINRLQHITAVACTSLRLCKKFGLDAKCAVRAAVLHDLFYYDWRDGKTGKWHRLHGYRHPRTAAMNSHELYPEISKKEERIILRHMWPLTILPPSSKEGFIVSLSDKYCATLEVLYSVGKIKASHQK